MPSTHTRRAAAVVAAVVLAYALLVAAQVLLGVLAGGLLGLVVYAGDAIARDVDRRRLVVLDAVAVVAFAYLVVVGSRPLLGVILGALVVLVGWLTAPRGPVARAARWLRAARADVRAIRESVESPGRGEGTPADGDADPGAASSGDD